MVIHTNVRHNHLYLHMLLVSPTCNEFLHQLKLKLRNLDCLQDKEKPHRIRSLAFTPEQHLGNFGDNVEACQIHDNFHIHEEGLKRKTEQHQIKAQRKTQVGLLFLESYEKNTSVNSLCDL